MANDYVARYIVKYGKDHNIIRRLTVYYDDMAEDPREWSNTCKIYCWHPEYKIGDETPGSPTETLMGICNELRVKVAENQSIISAMKMIELLQKNPDIVIKMISLYDHSSQSISTHIDSYPYNDPWDSMNIGFAYMTKKMAKENFLDYSDDTWRQRAEEAIDNEVKFLNYYIQGNVYSYVLEDKIIEKGMAVNQCTGEAEAFERVSWKFNESCGGFYGSNPFTPEGLEDMGMLFELRAEEAIVEEYDEEAESKEVN